MDFFSKVLEGKFAKELLKEKSRIKTLFMKNEIFTTENQKRVCDVGTWQSCCSES